MVIGLKKFLAISAVFAILGIGIHAAEHAFPNHSGDSCVLCVAASSVIPVNSVTVQPADPAILFNIVPVADVRVRSAFCSTALSRGPPLL